MNKEQYSVLIAQMSAQIIPSYILASKKEEAGGTTIPEGLAYWVVDFAKELARLAGVIEPKN